MILIHIRFGLGWVSTCELSCDRFNVQWGFPTRSLMDTGSLDGDYGRSCGLNQLNGSWVVVGCYGLVADRGVGWFRRWG